MANLKNKCTYLPLEYAFFKQLKPLKAPLDQSCAKEEWCKDHKIKTVCKLEKFLYGLKKAPMQWFTKFAQVVKATWFDQSEVDHSLFTKQTGGAFTTLLVYIDDMIITGDNKLEIEKLKKHMHHNFQIKDLGHVKYFLGIEVDRKKKGIWFNQRKYAMDRVTRGSRDDQC